MKKIITAAAVLALMSAVNVYAGSTTTAVSAPSGALDVGDTFEVSVQVTENTGFTSFDAFVEYDPSVIRMEGAGDVAADTLVYSQNTNPKMFISSEIINAMTSLVPERGDKDYKGKANGSSTAAEIGIVKLSSFVTAADENNMLKKQEGTGTLCTLKFKAVGKGSTTIKLSDTSFATISPSEKWTGDSSASVNVGGSSAAAATASTVTTETVTETTTAASNSGSGSRNITTAETSEQTTAETSAQTVTETVTETTTEAAAAAVSFNDLANYKWAAEYIGSLASKGIVNGYSDGSFKPGDNVKRCDFVVMLSRALGLENNGADNFSDVPADAYYADAVAAAKAAGIVNGNGDGTFAPASFITRQDMMLMAKGALEYKGIETEADLSVLDRFGDSASISAYAKEGVAAMVSAGVVSGTGSNVEPKGNTTRAQAAVIISKILEKTE